MAYIVEADLLNRISEDQLIQLSDDAGAGSTDSAVITRAITEADAEINGYVATKHSVPLASPTDLIKKLSTDITIHNLFGRRQREPEDVRQRYDDAVKVLKSIAKGIVTLGVDPAPPESSRATRGETFGPARIFDRDKLGSF